MFGKSKNIVFNEKQLKKAKPSKLQPAPDAEADNVGDMAASPPDASADTTVATAKKANMPRARKERDAMRLPFWRNKRTVGFILIGLAMFITLGVNPALSYFNAQHMAPAVVANVDIEVGSEITKEMLSDVSKAAEVLLPMQTMQSQSVVGKYATSRIVAGEIISQPKLSDMVPFNNAYLYQLPSGKKAMSVSVSKLSASISAKLEAGDVVSVYVPLANDSKEIRELAEQPAELTYVEVLSSTNVDGIDIVAPPEKSNLENPLPVTVTLAVDDLQAVILAGSEIRGGVHLSMVSRGDALRRAELLQQQAAYNDELLLKKKTVVEGGVYE